MKLEAVILRVGIIALVVMLASIVVICGSLYLGLEQVTQSIPPVMTTVHDEEVHSVIENFELISGSLEMNLNPDLLSNLMTGKYLENQLSIQSFDTFYITTKLEVSEVRVLEYTTSQFKAIGCGYINQDEVQPDGEYIRSLPRNFFQIVYVFIHENDRWKLAAAYNFTDRNGAIRDWNSVWDWERELIGDLPTYVYEHGGCGI